MGIGIQSLIYAQSADSTGYTGSGRQAAYPQKKSPTQRAARQLNTLQQKLDLNQDQVIQLRMVLLNENIALDSLRSNLSGDNKSDAYSRRIILQDADQKINALLTTNQKQLFAQWKEEQRQKAIERKKNQGAGANPAGGNPAGSTPAAANPASANPPQQ